MQDSKSSLTKNTNQLEPKKDPENSENASNEDVAEKTLEPVLDEQKETIPIVKEFLFDFKESLELDSLQYNSKENVIIGNHISGAYIFSFKEGKVYFKEGFMIGKGSFTRPGKAVIKGSAHGIDKKWIESIPI